ncbi:methyltransferase domain-containing protein [Cohnella lubricantis]|uniref:Methyltransferase domain-containing protein n=1 Tax=Cohnella lubricantis TaxID=2163172 RepID=A0A841TF41_9BACL|nr:methyltransferase domain-containing protein [Cohnella lubricantis]MBB6677840.1 methyltransferase domain-containing protein [Cohnella lubricantis]MBP2119019.1 2-polyprenyl-3-methyl-5-hydroxy-6-metoxy-1,4-benzoquinol methylase [Cohnella lubricantis]
MNMLLSQRSAIPELMDDFAQGGEELQQALRHLRRLNRIFGASGPIVYGVNYLWRKAGRPSRLTLLDVGSGSGDINRRLLRWADKQRIEMKVILCDVTEEAETEAKELFRHEPRVTFVRRSVCELAPGQVDIVTASQFVHHFGSNELPAIVRRLMEASRIGIVLNDIHRHWIPWTAVWLVTRLISANRYIRHDGPLSVAKGFRRSDFQLAARQLEHSELAVRWRPLFRYAVTIAKAREG